MKLKINELNPKDLLLMTEQMEAVYESYAINADPFGDDAVKLEAWGVFRAFCLMLARIYVTFIVRPTDEELLRHLPREERVFDFRQDRRSFFMMT